jgi:hypothetical protein
VLFGGDRWREDAVEILDLQRLGTRARVLALRDFDGDGTVEILLEVEQLRGGSIRVYELLFLRKNERITQEATWTLVEGQLEPHARRDLNGDGIQDIVLADYTRNHFLILQTNRQRGRGFSFALQRITMPKEAYASGGQEVKLFFDDLNGDDLLDIFTISASHNQLHMILRRPQGEAQPALASLPLLPRAADVAGAGWFEKALWFGDADRDGRKEILVLTNQVLDPDFVPPRSVEGRPADPGKQIRDSLKAGEERRYYAPYFRLLVYRIREAAVELVAKLNTRLPASSFYPDSILLRDHDQGAPPELVLEVVGRRNGRSLRSVLSVTGRLPPTARPEPRDSEDPSKKDASPAVAPPGEKAPATPKQP